MCLLLVDLDGVDIPVSVAEGTRVSTNEGSAGGETSRSSTTLTSPYGVCEVTTEGCVKDDLVVLEVAWDIGIWTTENLSGEAPVRVSRQRTSTLDV